MIQPTKRNSTGVRPSHRVAIGATVVIAALLAIWAFSTIVGVLAHLVTIAIVIAIVYGVTKLVLRHAGS